MTVWVEEQARKFGSVFTIWNGSHPMVVVTDADLARKLLMANTARPNLQIFGLNVGDDHHMAQLGLLDISPDKHGNKFRVMRKAFEVAVMSPQALSAHAVMLRECASRLVSYLKRYAATGEPVDMACRLSDMTMDATGFAAFGMDLDCLGVAGKGKADTTTTTTAAAATNGGAQQGKKQGSTSALGGWHASPLAVLSSSLFFPNYYDLIRYIGCALPDRLLWEERKVRTALRLALLNLIDQWKRHQQAGGATDSKVPLPAISDKGFMAKLLSSMESEPDIQEMDVVAQAFTMTLAGYETTASTLSACLHLLAQNQGAQARLHQELDDVLKGKSPSAEDLDRLPYLCAVLDEALRLYPPGDSLLRNQSKELDLRDGRVIPKNAFLWINIYAFQRDPAIWPRPTEFLPERHIQPGNEAVAPKSPQAFLPFGIGTRCVGYKFALLESRLALAYLLQAYTLHPAPGCPPPVWQASFVYSADHVWLTVSPRSNGN